MTKETAMEQTLYHYCVELYNPDDTLAMRSSGAIATPVPIASFEAYEAALAYIVNLLKSQPGYPPGHYRMLLVNLSRL